MLKASLALLALAHGATKNEWVYPKTELYSRTSSCEADKLENCPQDQWSKGWPKCADKNQSPIDIKYNVLKKVESKGKMTISGGVGKDCNIVMKSSGYGFKMSFQTDAGAGCKKPELAFSEWDGKADTNGKYTLLQWHVHTPSEHALESKRTELEMHYVFARTVDGKTQLAVVGELIKPGKANAIANAFFKDDATPATADALTFPKFSKTDDAQKALFSVEAKATTKHPLFPQAIADTINTGYGYYNYLGSLTTPPCILDGNNVRWTVIDTPVEWSAAQIKFFQDYVKNVPSAALQAGDCKELIATTLPTGMTTGCTSRKLMPIDDRKVTQWVKAKTDQVKDAIALLTADSTLQKLVKQFETSGTISLKDDKGADLFTADQIKSALNDPLFNSIMNKLPATEAAALKKFKDDQAAKNTIQLNSFAPAAVGAAAFAAMLI